jgi:hypothetical protein
MWFSLLLRGALVQLTPAACRPAGVVVRRLKTSSKASSKAGSKVAQLTPAVCAGLMVWWCAKDKSDESNCRYARRMEAPSEQ